ncbi:c-type cytochrome [Macrococcus lamae]|uniref:C-type cytochrome n=1 Tax=Macrococcus lamae TaxID=198484 RepID=A0A4R6BWH5_9STAP|nr:c-type cytochrome [Macrococcus lamae]TDM12563.1 c-type cytochrome [Macrococcus lamae]
MKKQLAFLCLGTTVLLAACNSPKEQLDDYNKGDDISVSSVDPNTKKGKLIREGSDIMTSTNSILPEHVGNKLSCTSCHAGAGTGQALKLVGVANAFPQYRDREGRMTTLAERVNGCFERSMNGKALAEDSKEMKSIIAYLEFISPKDKYKRSAQKLVIKDIPVPDVKRGEAQFSRSNCITCHGNSSEYAPQAGPALWGDGSFNDGAGLSRFSKMYDFIYNYMPYNNPGSLTKQQASDLAAYVLSNDRPVFKDTKNRKFYPKGGRPDDKISEKERELIKKNLYKWEDLKAVEKS